MDRVGACTIVGVLPLGPWGASVEVCGIATVVKLVFVYALGGETNGKIPELTEGGRGLLMMSNILKPRCSRTY